MEHLGCSLSGKILEILMIHVLVVPNFIDGLNAKNLRQRDNFKMVLQGYPKMSR